MSVDDQTLTESHMLDAPAVENPPIPQPDDRSGQESMIETLDVPAGESPPIPQTDGRSGQASMIEEGSSAESGQRPVDPIGAQLVAQFERWVDRMLAGEEPPAGIPREILDEAREATGEQPQPANLQADLYTLFAGLTTLTGEVRLQGRAFRQLTDAMAPLAELPPRLGRIEQSQSHALDLLDRSAAEESADELPVSSDEVCSVMVDLYDRLQRGLRTSDSTIESLADRKSRGGFRAWLAGTSAFDQAIASAQAIRDASALTLSRVETILHDWGIERVGKVGETFDPLRMTAMDVRPDPDAEPGTVLEVNRSGYSLHGKLKATAQVTVAR